jgi:hypothetical protein
MHFRLSCSRLTCTNNVGGTFKSKCRVIFNDAWNNIAQKQGVAPYALQLYFHIRWYAEGESARGKEYIEGI